MAPRLIVDIEHRIAGDDGAPVRWVNRRLIDRRCRAGHRLAVVVDVIDIEVAIAGTRDVVIVAPGAGVVGERHRDGVWTGTVVAQEIELFILAAACEAVTVCKPPICCPSTLRVNCASVPGAPGGPSASSDSLRANVSESVRKLT